MTVTRLTNFITLFMVIAFVTWILGLIAFGRDDGRYANSPLKGWFNSLKSGRGFCCSFADGSSVSDVDWDTKDGHYRVRLDGQWIDVPDNALITEPNRFGPAVVWPYYESGTGVQIRCFMPGTLS